MLPTNFDKLQLSVLLLLLLQNLKRSNQLRAKAKNLEKEPKIKGRAKMLQINFDKLQLSMLLLLQNLKRRSNK